MVCVLEEGKDIVNLANLRIRISEFVVVSPEHFLRFSALQSRHHSGALLASFCKKAKNNKFSIRLDVSKHHKTPLILSELYIIYMTMPPLTGPKENSNGYCGRVHQPLVNSSGLALHPHPSSQSKIPRSLRSKKNMDMDMFSGYSKYG